MGNGSFSLGFQAKLNSGSSSGPENLAGESRTQSLSITTICHLLLGTSLLVASTEVLSWQQSAVVNIYCVMHWSPAKEDLNWDSNILLWVLKTRARATIFGALSRIRPPYTHPYCYILLLLLHIQLQHRHSNWYEDWPLFILGGG